MSRRQYALGTYLETVGPWDVFDKGRALCSDGKVRTLKRIAQTADTWFSVPASVEVKGKTISGYISTETIEGSSVVATDDNPAIVKFSAYTYGKNGDVLPEGMSTMAYLETLEGMTKYLLGDDGNMRVPCSRYGHDTISCIPITFAVVTIMAQETGEPVTTEGIDHIMGLVVNDHEDPDYIIRNYGREYGFNPGTLLDD